MESVGISRNFWNGKNVFLTGHTGFKGGWLSIWLSSMESQIKSSTIANICNVESLQKAISLARPDIVIHMAAQPLVRYSYKNPVETYQTNVMGTINLFEAIKKVPTVRAIVNITTDKCYENREWIWPYRENEPMGGIDPYSSSKACAELVTSAYRKSFFSNENVYLASVRAGNVIGGGDWAEDRLIPDFFRALDLGQPLIIRYPEAIRPWQHVLEPLAGYIMLAEKLYNNGDDFASSWNIGPDDTNNETVEWIVEYLCAKVPNANWQRDFEAQLHEASTLKLDSTKAKTLLGWQSQWSLEKSLDKTLEWYMAWKNNNNMLDVSMRQIHSYESSI